MFEDLPTTPQSFSQSILVQSLTALKKNRYSDNFDAERFNYDGVDHSGEFYAEEHAYFLDWFVKHSDALFAAYLHLKDDASRRLYLYLIAYRLAGHSSVKLPVWFADKKAEFAAFLAMETHGPSQFMTSGVFGKLRHYDFRYRNHRYIADCLGFTDYLFRGQYFYARDGLAIAPEQGDAVIDGGAWTGDTTIVFSNAVGDSGCVYAFEPVEDHLQILKHNLKQFTHQNVKVMPFGLSDTSVVAPPIVLNKYQPGFKSGAWQNAPLRSLDALVKAKEIPRIDLIKLDVEGAEMEALRGAVESIGSFRPKLAVSLYHKPDDLFEIILFIKEKFPFYSCFIDHYTIHAEETVLYCTAKPEGA